MRLASVPELGALNAEERFGPLLALGLKPRELEDLEAQAIQLSRLDPCVFSSFVFGWSIQPIHREIHDLLSNYDRLVIWAPIEHGKTNTVSIARVLWELGRDSSMRIGSISDTEGQALKSLQVVKQHIETNPRLRAVFPHLKPEKRPGRYSTWHEEAIIVQREGTSRDFSVECIGAGGALLGARLDLIHLDDVLDHQNTLTAGQRKKVCDWFESTVESRATMFGRIAITGTGWHREDLMYVTAKRKGWKSRRFDAIKEVLWPQLVYVDGKPYGWPAWRLRQKQETTNPYEWMRQFRCMHASQASEIFNMRAVEGCFDPDTPYDPEPIQGENYYVGVDLNVKKGEHRHETVFFVGRCSGPYRIVQKIVARNMSLLEIGQEFLRIEARFHPVLFLVENNAAQDYVLQLLRPETLEGLVSAFGGSIDRAELQTLPRIEGFVTGANKSDPSLGIRGMTIEFEQKRWRIPDHLETRKWAGQLEAFQPEDHAGDVLMASWLFSNAVTRYRPRRAISRSVGSRR